MPRHSDELNRTRATLIQRLKNWQDQPSWQEFFDMYWKLPYGVARKAGLSDAEAQDVVQETMASVAKHMPTFEYDPAIGSFKAWLAKLTRWRIIDQIRKRQSLIQDQSASSDSPTGTGAVEKIIDPESLALDDLWNAEWERNLLDAAIANVKRKMDPQKYQIFDFYVNKQWSAEKVAAQFGVPVPQVYLAKHRVTELIKAEVKRLEKEMT
jgi:RNA polymerase sigma-70 factor (ECF subfamily)